jgi:hypothetical protein
MVQVNSEWREITVESEIHHELFRPHQLSGVAERIIRTLKEMSMSMLVQLDFSLNSGLTTVVYIRNRLMSNSSLLQRQHSFSRNSHLKTFSCLSPRRKAEILYLEDKTCPLLGFV